MEQSNVNSYLLATVTKALEILEPFDSNRDDLSMTQIAEAINLPKSSVFRYLATLERYNYLERDSETERYHLGMKLLQLGAIVTRRHQLRSVALPVMAQLRETFGETVNLVIPRRDKVIYLEVLESPSAIKMSAQIGQEDFAHASALGKAMLSLLSPAQLDTMEKWPLIRCTDNTITEWPALLLELEEVRRRGFAIDERESNMEVRCVGAAIQDYRSQVAAISISGPENRLTRVLALEIGPELMKATNHVSALLGHKQGHQQNT